MCSTTVGDRFDSNMDGAHPTHLYVAALLERNIKTLIFVGVADFLCNWVGNERWTLALDWTGKDAFSSTKLREWYVSDKVAGMTRSAGGLTYATIFNAGHMVCGSFLVLDAILWFVTSKVPYDRPRESLEMVQRWLAGQNL
jgi:cathepsin A (carboxypeptidase C)